MPWLRVSHRQQRQQADCLAACAAMVLEYFGVSFRYEQLLPLLHIRSHGTTFSALRALTGLGVSVRIDSGEIANLQGYLIDGIPPIVFVNTGLLSYWTSQTGHALVVTGIDEQSVIVHDPAIREPNKHIPIVEFEMAWIEQDQRYAVVTRAASR